MSRELMREVDMRNLESLLRWRRAWVYGWIEGDHRGEITGAAIDAKHASAVRLAKHHRDKILADRPMAAWRAERERNRREAADKVLPLFLRRQAT